MPRPQVILVAAMAHNGAIGHRGGMPWHLPADLGHFKAVTVGHPIVMGRRTFESIGRALPGRRNVVVSRSRPDLPDGVIVAGRLDEALEACGDAEQIMVIGGGEIYRAAMPNARRMELTLIDADIEADTFFPEWSLDQWRLESMTMRPSDERNAYSMCFCSLVRERPA